MGKRELIIPYAPRKEQLTMNNALGFIYDWCHLTEISEAPVSCFMPAEGVSLG